jgi:hypothetical protein
MRHYEDGFIDIPLWVVDPNGVKSSYTSCSILELRSWVRTTDTGDTKYRRHVLANIPLLHFSKCRAIIRMTKTKASMKFLKVLLLVPVSGILLNNPTSASRLMLNCLH